ncbi:hypothetical protein [Primorskyibacter sp. S187A]|uniref:hypothetical protein n=1 Tax=Primorskyibacter sp. S187A TaxID=3415130 RepID=UPI003C79943C
MIRSLLLASAFLVVTIVLLAMQPSDRPAGFASDPIPAQSVTRTDSGVSASLAPLGARTVPVETPSVAREGASEILADPQDKVAAMTAKILQELRQAPTDAQPAQQEASVPAPVSAAAPVAAPVRPTPVTFQDRLAEAARSGLSDIDLARLVQDGMETGEVSLGAEVYTAAGTLDVNAVLASLIPERANSDRVRPITQSFIYRIQPTDSLAGLAVLFYGDASAHRAILAENAQSLTTPEDLSAGMLITIPAL